ncbi:MAG: DUF805 domain-containing protein [Lentilactobacillus hilgardii]|jgi:uncharacterized membrane protein YhaH (DUF805 family)|uniref:DUF805 domain-containing protein n=2 Tax=Lentilactobacillus hilgardii TaxID=1588 RepID=C0XFX2_LENH9|nr:DUF805 domain-containing protein [Lentilactobacillus hilgardii]EEI18390.1 hypothetical protein HMPREF0497_2881 [Lentilactobacillus buchneri ATCC 11577]MCI1923690.1 DUF805 domain-containing protein [Lentilactobacillus buchneri]RRG11721.1 MAG: DUF805 domain-containing protein [Lactobacillus sp.]EEI25688.1 hypothetical protein HMPREF0519_0133 [Lentilactobacillus hilgardii DSM 20176 = ATCC 8290]EEI69850.1 hypothetical protein HMPREF0496_2909 [Lentilactobacillus hilgardii ATCC 27305]
MITSYKRFWKNIFNVSGTASRSDYWWPIIINYVLGIIAVIIISHVTGYSFDSIRNLKDLAVDSTVRTVGLIVWIATFTVKIRRLHDSDHVGWWILIDLVPLIGTIWFFILMVFPSKANRWDKR